MRKSLLLFLLITTLPLYSSGDSLRSSYGAYVNFMLNLHDADFSRIPDCPSCSPGFRTGFGVGPALGILYEHPLNTTFSLGAKLSYQDVSGLLTASETTKVIVNSISVDGEFEHSMEVSITNIGIEPYLLFAAYDKINFSIGLHIGSIMSKNYSQKELIVKPENTGTFLNPDGSDSFSRTRNEFAGELQKAATLFVAPTLGVSYKLQLNSKSTLNAYPELSYQLGLTNIVDDPLVSQWTVNSLRAGIAIKYTPEPKKEKIQKFENIYKIDTVQIQNDAIASSMIKSGVENKKISTEEDDDFIVEITTIRRTDTLIIPIIYDITAKINAVGLNNNNQEVDKPKFVIEEFSTARLQPLLNYIFFDSTSAIINSRYKRINKNDTQKFSVDSLYDLDVIATYHNMLNIYGKRMNEFPNAKITVIGCNDGAAEKSIGNLSLDRANSVKNYLVDVWNINPDRITVKSRDLPEQASTPINDFEKAQENRRVEIISNDYEITKPIFASYSIRTTSIPGLRFKPEVKAEAGVSKWEIEISQDNRLLKNFEFVNDKVQNVDWILSEDKRNIPVLDKPLEFVVKVIDSKGNTKISDKGRIEIEQITVQKKRQSGIVDKEIENFSLILFDFAKSDISAANNQIINFVKSRLKKDSKVKITGYTDRTGEADYNKKLSERRANAVNSAMKHIGSTFSGVGEDVLLYNNDFPEGRFYCRTIDIMVESEVK